MCVCVRERERERKRERHRERKEDFVREKQSRLCWSERKTSLDRNRERLSVCEKETVSMCVLEIERKRERDR